MSQPVQETSAMPWWKQGAWMLLASVCGALLWGLPLLQASKAQFPEDGFGQRMYKAFFSQQETELLIGKGVDLFGSFWMVEQVRAMVVEGKSSVLSDLYAPFGFDLGKNTGFAWADALLGVPLASWLGIPGFWNLHVLLVCLLSIFGTCVLMRCTGLMLGPSIGLALLCFINPFMIDELDLGRPTQISIWPMALLLAVFVRQQRRGFTPWHGVLAGVTVALSCLTYWFTGIAAGVCMALLFVWELFRKRQWTLAAGFAGSALLTAAAIVLPLTWRMTGPLLRGRGTHNYTKLLGDPDHRYAWLGLNLQTEYDIFSWSDLVYVFKASCQLLPFFIVIVVSAGLKYGRREKTPWLLLWIFTLGMSLSSGLNVFGVHLPTGLAVLEWVFPPMLRCQFEGRNVVVANLLGFVVVAITLRSLLATSAAQRFRGRIGWGITVLCVVWVLAMRPTPATLATTGFEPATELASKLKKAPGGVIEFPLFASNYTFVQQIYHQQPIFGGMGFDTVRPIRHVRYAQDHDGIQAVQTMMKKGQYSRPLSKAQRQRFVEDGFPWIIVYPSEDTPPLGRLRHFFGAKGEEVYGYYLFDLRQKR